MYSRRVLSPIPAAFAASALVRLTRRACRAFSLRGVVGIPPFSGGFCGFLAVIEGNPIMEAHCHQPRLTAAPVEQGRRSIVEFLCVPCGLFHSLRYVQPLHALDFNMYPWESGQVRHLSKGQRTSPLDGIAMLTEQGGKFPLPVCSLALGLFSRQNHPRPRGILLCFPARLQFVPAVSRLLILGYQSQRICLLPKSAKLVKLVLWI